GAASRSRIRGFPSTRRCRYSSASGSSGKKGKKVPDPSTLGVFFGAGFVLLMTPGPAVLYIVTRSIEQGRKAGLVSVLGIVVGTRFPVGAGALGVSALLMSSALAFNALRYLGAMYLIYLGVRTLAEREPPLDAPEIDRAGLGEIFSQGVVVN